MPTLVKRSLDIKLRELVAASFRLPAEPWKSKTRFEQSVHIDFVSDTQKVFQRIVPKGFHFSGGSFVNEGEQVRGIRPLAIEESLQELKSGNRG